MKKQITKEHQQALKILFTVAEKALEKGVYANLKESAFTFGAIEALRSLVAPEGK